MNESSKSTLAAIERCVTESGTSVKVALEAAYQLGCIDGGLEVAAIGLRQIERLAEPA